MTATLAIPEQRAVGNSIFYRPELDVLRFFAFFAVFGFHLPRHTVEFYVEHGVPGFVGTAANSLMESGVFGVDLFFVLSAYLITDLLLREKKERGKLDVPAFYMRRILRIWPLYFFFIGIALIPALNPNHVFTWRHVAAFLLLCGNWSIIFYGWPIPSVVGPLWTVSIEEQFYLLWPPIVRTLSADRIALAAFAMLVVSNITRIAMVAIHAGPTSVWCNTLGRLDPIAAGILVAAVLRGSIPNFPSATRLGMLCCGLLPLTLVAHFWQINGPDRLEWLPTLVGYPIVAASCTLVMLSALGMSARLPSALLYLGKISYGLYVYHALGNFLADKVITAQAGLIRLALRIPVALGLTILMASVSYSVLERPFLRLKKRFAHVDSRPV
jgi:peptidoglycan/LPS O-acetylase OafA/YrhL